MKIPMSLLVQWMVIPLMLCALAYGVTYGGFRMYEKATAVSLSTLDSCFATSTKANSRSACLHTTAAKLLSQYSVEDIFSYSVASSSTEIVRNNCHAIGHVVGDENYKRIGSLEKALSLCPSTCLFACIHGTLGAGVLAELGEKYSEEDIVHADAAAITKIGIEYCEQSVALCHGIGHVLYILNNDNLKKSMDICTLIADGFAQEACFQGTFMERAGEHESIKPFQATTTYQVLDNNDYLYPCLSVGSAFRHACFQFLPEYQNILFLRNGITNVSAKLQKSIDVCDSLSGRDRASCFEGIGIEANIFTSYAYDVVEIGRLCTSMPTLPDREACSLGIIPRAFFSQGYGLDYCATIQETKHRETCFNAAFRWMRGTLTSSQIVDECNKLNASATCNQYLKRYNANETNLPDYRLGLFGKIK